MGMLSVLPNVPVKHAEFIEYAAAHPNKPLLELLEPFKHYDAKLREVFAQEPDHPALADQLLNVVPVFNGHEKDLIIRARDPASESDAERERFVMPLNTDERRPSGSPAIVSSLKDFQQNFALFCESSLVDLDWSNVVAAGSSVVTCILPVPGMYKKSKRALRQFYHETIAPASDVDLFIYGLDEEEAIQKIIQIEQKIKDSILTETTTVRTKNAITIVSQYPTRHVQIVLRTYKSVAEILTGFDVDCSCAAYDGKQVYAAPRALTSYMSQCNTIDLTRRSPSYENRLSKYSHRGFEVHWPLLERSRIDPTIFERNFGRTVGLARLLVLERLPSKSERESYMDQRRRERGRPAINRSHRLTMYGNIKESHEDEVAEWVEADDISDYNTLTLPYGPTFHAKKIEKLLYSKDLLLNAEWNKKEDREVNLHRHPAFFGHAEDVMHDCCGFCPKPVTPEEYDVAEEEDKIYVSGPISFIRDDPGRQAIGSFNPITDDDWTEMAYIGNTARLCQAIIEGDVDHVNDWLEQEGSDPNCRDLGGRTPLHLAVMSSTAEVVRALISHDARLVARLADGRTSLHLAAARGNVEMVRMILQKSEENEEEEAKKEDVRKQARIAARGSSSKKTRMDVDKDPEDNDVDMLDNDSASDVDMKSTTTGSYVKIQEEKRKAEANDDVIPEEDEDDPDVFDVNVLAWDLQCSPLHLAILHGHIDVVKELVQTFGADVLLPIKLLNSYDRSPRGAILTLVLALGLPLERAKAMTKALLELGASSAQADMRQTTALHYVSQQEPEVLETLCKHDEPAAKRAINHLSVTGSSYSPSAQSPLMSAIQAGNSLAALKLLAFGANASIDFRDWLRSIETQFEDVTNRHAKRNQDDFLTQTEQPIILAAQAELPEIVLELLSRGADPNTLTKQAQQGLGNEWYRNYNVMESTLDIVRAKLHALKSYQDEAPPEPPKLTLVDDVDYLDGIKTGSYKHFIAQIQLNEAKSADLSSQRSYEESMKRYAERKGMKEKSEAIRALTVRYEELEHTLVSKGARLFKELYPDLVKDNPNNHCHSVSPTPKPEPWSVSFDFNVHDLTDEMVKDAYIRLFQAAWDGDLAAIKKLTLSPLEGDRTPLKIAVEDKHDQSPFSIAVLRGHYEVARAIVEIAWAQFDPEEKKDNVRYRLRDDVDEDYGDDTSNSNEIPVYTEIVDDKFTIENIGEVSTQIKSKVRPTSLIAWSVSTWKYVEICSPSEKFTYGLDERKIRGSGTVGLAQWAVITDNFDLFTLLLDLDIEWTDREAPKENDMLAIPGWSQEIFDLAIKYGRLKMLAEMIKHTGAGIRLESLVKQSGIRFREPPKYYQGLSVNGKKRVDWAAAARGMRVSSISDSSPPLLEAAFKGSLASVEWFFSNTPARHYNDFGEAYKSQKYIEHLNKHAGGFPKIVSKYLSARQEIALHCAVMAKPRDETNRLLEYLIKVAPASVHFKSSSGHTPLALAFSLRRLDAAKILIDAGANQIVRDLEGNNILHLLLISAFTSRSRGEKYLKEFLGLIDQRLVPSLLLERSAGSLTPLARWMKHAYGETNTLKMLLEFAESTHNEHLAQLDGSGDSPIHHAVSSRNQDWLELMLARRPDLLYQESATGRTPAELAQDNYIGGRVSGAPSITTHGSWQSLLHRSAESFAPDYKTHSAPNNASIWRFCEQFMKEHPGKRRLVTLAEANEVANRLASMYTRRSRGADLGDDESDAESEVEDSHNARDEVSRWFYRAPNTGYA